jgi:hypothetical protein
VYFEAQKEYGKWRIINNSEIYKQYNDIYLGNKLEIIDYRWQGK